MLYAFIIWNICDQFTCLYPDENVCCLIMEIHVYNPEIKLEIRTASATSQCDELCGCCFWVHFLSDFIYRISLIRHRGFYLFC